SNAIYGIAMSDEERKQSGIRVCLSCQRFRRRWSRVTTLAAPELTATCARHREIEFRNRDFELEGFVICDRLIDILEFLSVEICHTPMPLDADSRDGSALREQTFEQQQGTLVLCTTLNVVIVVVQRYGRIGFAGKLERLGE